MFGLIDQLWWRAALRRLWRPFWRWEFASIGIRVFYLLDQSIVLKGVGRAGLARSERFSGALSVAFNQTGVDETWGVSNASVESTNRVNKLR